MFKKNNVRTTNTKAYMSSYDWTYRVLNIIDFLEQEYDPKLPDWSNFKNYCEKNDLNWRVIKKMMEYSVNHYFESEKEMMNFKYFKPLTKEDNINRLKESIKKTKDVEINFNPPKVDDKIIDIENIF